MLDLGKPAGGGGGARLEEVLRLELAEVEGIGAASPLKESSDGLIRFTAPSSSCVKPAASVVDRESCLGGGIDRAEFDELVELFGAKTDGGGVEWVDREASILDRAAVIGDAVCALGGGASVGGAPSGFCYNLHELSSRKRLRVNSPLSQPIV